MVFVRPGNVEDLVGAVGLMEAPSRDQDSQATGKFLLELRNVSRTFGTFKALSDVTLTLPRGRVGLLGPNGAGKSTLLKILMGLIPPTAGTGRILDEQLGGDGDSEGNWQLRRLIGFMPEADALVPGLTGVEYVSLAGELYGMPRREAQRRAHEVLSYLELEEARYRRVEEYSAGMKQRAKLAQALVHDPPVLLLDEPTSGLDPAGRDALLRLVKSLATDHGKSVILSTHLLADVEAVCERVVILAGGRIRGQGMVAELCARRQDRYRLRVQGDPARFRTSLLAVGVTILADNGEGEWRVAVPVAWTNVGFFQRAVEHEVIIRSLLPDDETLEELFLRTVSDKVGGRIMNANWISGSADLVCGELAELFRKHSVESVRDSNTLRFPAHPGLWVNGEAIRQGEWTIQLDVRLGVEPNRTLIESVAGIDKENEPAIHDGLAAFERGSFPVLLAAFFGRSKLVDRLHWEIAGRKRLVFVGEVTTRFGFPLDEKGNPDVRFYHAFVNLLRDTSLPGGTHWVRLYQMRGGELNPTNEVLLDNTPWPEMQAALDAFDWPKSARHYDVRVFLVIRDDPFQNEKA